MKYLYTRTTGNITEYSDSPFNDGGREKYIDVQGILGSVGEVYTLEDLLDIYRKGIRQHDPVISEYANYPKWLAATLPFMKEIEDF